MYGLLIFIVISSFLALLVLNVYFRVKVMKVYKRLVQNRVDFQVNQLFNADRLQKEVLSKYPKHKDDILEFANHIRNSMKIGIVLVALIAIAGGILYYYR